MTRLSERKKSNKQIIIEKFVLPDSIPVNPSSSAKLSQSPDFEALKKKSDSFWAAEMRICGRLVKRYGEDFLLWVFIPRQYDSMLAYSGKWGQKFLAEQFFEYKKNVAATKTGIVKTKFTEGEKVGEDAVIEHKPRTLKDFLNLFQ